MHNLTVKHIDAFTQDLWSGNPAGVVVDAQGLSDEQMQNIAREMNLSETAFVLPATQKGADLRVRWFTPSNEVDLCGHATIASFHALAEENLYGMQTEGTYPFTIETRSGLLGVLVDKTSSGQTIQFELPVPSFREISSVPEGLLQALGFETQDLSNAFPCVAEAYAYLPIRSRAALQTLQPAYRDLAAACDAMKVGGICVFTLETADENSAVHSRFFAPSLGVDEDPVTGSANGPLGVYLHTYVRPRGIPFNSSTLPDGRIECIGEQGDSMNRPGRVRIRLSVDGETVRQVWIAGHAVTVMNANISLKDKG